MKKARLWYVIADGGRARFVERDDQGAFRTLSSFVSTELHTSAHELGLDRPARVKESASPARSAIEPAATCTRRPKRTSSALSPTRSPPISRTRSSMNSFWWRLPA